MNMTTQLTCMTESMNASFVTSNAGTASKPREGLMTGVAEATMP